MRGKPIPVLLMACFCLAIVYAPVGQQAATSTSTALQAAPEGPASEVFLRIQESYGYRVTPAGSHEIWIDLKGVHANLLAGNFSEWKGLVTGYRANPLVSSKGRPSVRVALSVREPKFIWAHQEPAGLHLFFGDLVAAKATSASPVTVPASLPADSTKVPSRSEVPQSAEVARVTGISIIVGDNGKTVVDVATTKPIQFKPFQLADPMRLVVDLQRTEALYARQVYASHPGVLKDVRVAQFSVHPSLVTRVVADLAATTPSIVEAEPHGVRIQLQRRPAPVEVRESLASPARMTSTKVSLYDSDEVRNTGISARTQAPRATTATPEVVDLTRPVKVAWATTESSGTSGSLAEKTIQPAIRTSASQPNLIANASLPPQVQQALRAAQVVAGSSQAAQPPLETTILSTPSVQQAAPMYTGKLISLDLKAVDIRDFFRLIHQISGLNIVVDSDVTGRVTLVLDDVPWDQALDLVLKNNDLGKVFEGNVLRIAKVQTLTTEAQSQATLREAKLESEPLVTIFRRLKYAHTSDQKPSSGGGGMGGAGGGGGGMGGGLTSIPGVASILKSFQKGTVLSERGNVVEDPRDNAVIITDVPSQIPVIESVIGKLDTKAKQVSIQVRVILANADFSRTLSTVLGAAFHNRSGSTSGAGGTGQGITGTANLPPPLPPLSAITQSASVGASGFGAFAITNAGARYAINAAISAAETHDQARTISRPTIVTQDNVLGEVQQGVQIPIQTNINNTIAVQYVNATLMLSVTPQVTVDNKVFLNIYVNNASIGTISTFTGPSINTQQATTQVLVPDGGTVVFGGITVTTRGRSATYIPLLGSIPVIGNLFKSSQVNDQNQELLFFVTPMVLPG